MNQTEAKIYEFFEQRRIRLGNCNESILSCNYVEQGLVDSMAIVDFVLHIESVFDIRLGPDEMSSNELFSIATTAALVQRIQSEFSNCRDAA